MNMVEDLMVCSRFYSSNIKPIYEGNHVALFSTQWIRRHQIVQQFYARVNAENTAGAVQHRSRLYDTVLTFI